METDSSVLPCYYSFGCCCSKIPWKFHRFSNPLFCIYSALYALISSIHFNVSNNFRVCNLTFMWKAGSHVDMVNSSINTRDHLHHQFDFIICKTGNGNTRLPTSCRGRSKCLHFPRKWILHLFTLLKTKHIISYC